MNRLGKYEKWSVDRLSLSLSLLTLDMSRHFAVSTDELKSLAERSRVRICFTEVDRILLSDFSAGQTVSDLEHDDTTGKTTYRLTLSGGSSIEITAAGLVEIPY